eukprot:9503973-Pyramimonas_sp.AAC.2
MDAHLNLHSADAKAAPHSPPPPSPRPSLPVFYRSAISTAEEPRPAVPHLPPSRQNGQTPCPPPTRPRYSPPPSPPLAPPPQCRGRSPAQSRIRQSHADTRAPNQPTHQSHADTCAPNQLARQSRADTRAPNQPTHQSHAPHPAPNRTHSLTSET